MREQKPLCYGSGSEMSQRWNERFPRWLWCPWRFFLNTQRKKKLNGNSTVCALAIAEYLILGGKHLKFWDMGQEKLVVEEGTLLSEEVPLQMDPPASHATQVDFSQFWWLTCQCSILFNNMGSINRKSEFRKPENLNKPIVKCERFNVAELSLLKEFLVKQLCSCHHVGRGCDRQPTDARQLF